MKRKRTVKAVHPSDIEEFLQSAGILGDIRDKKIECEHCNKTISLDNIGKIRKSTSGVVILCNSYNCYPNYDDEGLNHSDNKNNSHRNNNMVPVDNVGLSESGAKAIFNKISSLINERRS
jgi:hypothetical protein